MANIRCFVTLSQLLVISLLIMAMSTSADSEIESLTSGSGGRKLLQGVSGCSYDFSKVDFSNVTKSCTAPDYSKNACCSPFKALACKYTPDINNLNTLCPIYFISYMNMAGNYPDGVFIGQNRCDEDNKFC